MVSSRPARTCRACGAVLAADNRADLCSPCTRRAATSDLHPPVPPGGFWDRPQMRDALERREFGAVLAAYRSGQDRKVTQADLGRWLGITQGEVSRIERGSVPVSDLDKLDRWARVLGIPQRCLWFTLSGQVPDACHPRPGVSSPPLTGDAEGDDVHRRQFLKVAGSGVAAAGTSLLTGTVNSAPTALTGSSSVGGSRGIVTERECVERLAWELWQRGVDSIHASELPLSVAAYLSAVDTNGKLISGITRISPDGLIVGDRDNYFTFVQRSLIDFYVGRRIFGDITAGHNHLLATAQTSHETDLVLQALVQRHEPSVDFLARWMRDGSTAVLRVNSAGVLAKIGDARITDAVVTVLKHNQDTRQLYLTAVANRVLNLPWGRATKVSASIETGQSHLHLSDEQTLRLAQEVHNLRDGAARWCSVVFLSQAANCESSEVARTALGRALHEEPCLENLRSIGQALIGNKALFGQ